MYPTNVKTNDYNNNRKKSTINTPLWLADYIYNILPRQYQERYAVDICCGSGNLSSNFTDVVGLDIVDYKSLKSPVFIQKIQYHKTDALENIEELDFNLFEDFIVVCNPPFNDEDGKYKKKLLPFLFFQKIINYFGPEIPLILFVPMGFRLNQRMNRVGKRKSKKPPIPKRYEILRESGAKITSILTLPIDCFEGVLFHSEVLFFNISGMDAHYWIEK